MGQLANLKRELDELALVSVCQAELQSMASVEATAGDEMRYRRVKFAVDDFKSMQSLVSRKIEQSIAQSDAFKDVRPDKIFNDLCEFFMD